MKHLLSIFLFLTFIFTLNGQPWINNLPQAKLQNGDLTFFEIQKAFNDYWEPFNVKNGYYELNGEQVRAPYWKQFKRWEWYWENRIKPETGEFPKTSAWEELQKYLKENPGSKSSSGIWTSMGPSTTSGGYAGLGRLNCVAFHPTDDNIIFVGAAAGGIWKTTNGGSSWIPLGDNNAVLGVSDIIIDESNNLYIATGDRDGGSMWSLGGGQYNDNNSVGVLKSTDGGATWNTTGLSFTASQQRTVNRMLLDQTNNILYAATSVGLYKTDNEGVSWDLLTSTNFVDIKFRPGNTSIIYASNWNGDIYRSTNSGDSFSTAYPSSNGRVELAVTAHNPDVVYALMESGGGLGGVYKSVNGGTSFSQVYTGSLNFLGWNCNGGDSGGQGSYDLCIAADPTNENNVFVGGVNTWKSTDGGVNWSATTHWSGCSGITTVHADQHFLKYQNNTSNLFLCNDGGFYKTNNNGVSWTHHGNGLVTSQIYRLGTAQTSSNDVILGLQDNGTKALLTGTWSDELGGDGFECAYDWSNHNIMYGEIYYGDIYRSTNHGAGWSSISSGITGSAWWCAPFVLDATTSSTLYIGYQDVWKSTNMGTNWSKISPWNGSTIRSLAVTPANASVICAATQTTLYRTINGGTSWSNITGTLPTGSGYITYVWIKATDQNTIWVSLGGYNSYGVYQTTDGGSNWTNISTGLPSIPVMCVIQNKQNTLQNELYAGTDVGVYVKVGSDNWSPFNSGLPNVVVTELDIYYNAATDNSRLRAATYGRGLWESDLYSGSTPLELVANFTGSPTTVVVGNTVTFTDLSNGPNPITSYSWSFPGGTPSTANTAGPHIITYNTVGNYYAELTVGDGSTEDTETKPSDYITVFDCSVTTYPYIQNFDGFTLSVPDFACTADGSVALSECWTNATGDDIDWDVFTGSTGSSSTGPITDHTGSGNYLYTESSSCFSSIGNIVSPVFNLTSLSNPELRFWYHMYGVAMGTLSVQGSTDGGITWSSDMWSLSANQGDSWQEAIVSLSSFSSETELIVRFNATTGTDYTSDIAIDDFSISDGYLPGENCTNPQDLSTLTSPFSATTSGYTNDFSFCAMGSSPDRIFFVDVPNGYTVEIWQSWNNFNSTHTMRYSGTCPGDIEIGCINDDDYIPISWENLTGSTERVWFVVGGNGTDFGNFTLEWTLTPTSIPQCYGDIDIDGVGTTTWNYPLSTFYHDARVSSIYLASEFGCIGGDITSMQYYVSTVPGQEMNAFTIRMKHIVADSYLSANFETSGWTTVYQASESISTIGWHTFNFTTPFNFNGIDNIEVDVCFNNDSYTTDGDIYYFDGGANRSKYYRCDGCSFPTSDPLTWTDAASLTTNVPRVLFTFETEVILDLKAYLEGSFNGSNMDATINGHLPLSQPFNMPLWDYSGTESVGSIPNSNVVDWVLVDVRDAASAATATSATSIAKQAAFILNDGSIVDLDGSSNIRFDVSIIQNMFVVVWQRNHLGIMANTSVPSSSGVYSYDFTTGINQVFGGIDGHKEISIGIWGMIGGDGNHDGTVNVNDKSPLWETQAGKQGYIESDHNLDGETNNQDKDDIWVPNQNKSSQVPN